MPLLNVVFRFWLYQTLLSTVLGLSGFTRICLRFLVRHHERTPNTSSELCMTLENEGSLEGPCLR